MNDSYFIKSGYQINPEPRVYEDSEDDSATYQVDVYRFAARCATRLGTRSLLDLGCGYGLKLALFFDPDTVDIIGVDGEHAIDYCRSRHAFGRWLVDDLESPRRELESPVDLIIAADVIEHLKEPDALLSFARRCAHAETYLVVSTPERDLRRGPDSMGPPGNPAHVREWNRAELAAYLVDRNLAILEHQIMDLRGGMRTCQTVLARFV